LFAGDGQDDVLDPYLTSSDMNVVSTMMTGGGVPSVLTYNVTSQTSGPPCVVSLWYSLGCHDVSWCESGTPSVGGLNTDHLTLDPSYLTQHSYPVTTPVVL
jgi:hypothetical protein